MPLARHALHTTGEDIHIALWSAVHGMHSVVSRQYAFEGRCFVLAVGAIQPTAELPAELRIPPAAEGGPGPLALTGGSAIIGPDGEYLTEPVFGEERLVVADLDFAALARESLTLDVAGHYSRPDLFEVKIHRNSRGHAAAGQGDGQIPSTNSTSDEAVA